MTDTTQHLTRIRELAEAGCDRMPTGAWSREQFEAILHNLNQMEGAMDTDTTDDAQWWIVSYKNEWSTYTSPYEESFVDARRAADGSDLLYRAVVHCPRAEAEQAAVDAWADAGFAHAPKQAPGPKSVGDVAPDYLDELAESQRLAWKDIARLELKGERLQATIDGLERRVCEGWAKQGETNTRITRDLEHHIHPTYVTGPTGEPTFAEWERAEGEARIAKEGTK